MDTSKVKLSRPYRTRKHKDFSRVHYDYNDQDPGGKLLVTRFVGTVGW